jgi:signal peptidase I
MSEAEHAETADIDERETRRREAPAGSDAGRAEPGRDRSRARLLTGLAEMPVLVVLALVVAILIKTFLVQAFYIPSGSMVPTLRVGDRVLVEKISYRLHDVRRGDVIVFERPSGAALPKPADLPWYEDLRNFLRELVGLPTGAEEDYIKRVVAVGGDSVRYDGSPRKLYVNGSPVPQDYILHGVDRHSPRLASSDCRRLDMKPSGGGCLVPKGHVFVMGDHRGNSEDSRFIGPIPDDTIVGRAFTIIWPPGDMTGL